MERIKKVVLIVIFIITLFIVSPDNIYADNGSSEYVINKYDVNIVVNENNTFDITEIITAYFYVSKHGIYRTIPLNNNITRLDGSTSKNRAQVTNIVVNNEYTTSKENGNLKIKIGSPDYLVKGEQTYSIRYRYNIGKDPLKDMDELYYNIIGSEWDTTISNITFTIVMPKEFDTSRLGFSSGYVGSVNNQFVNYRFEGNKIIGSFDHTLNPGEALTVRCELPEGYFVGAGLLFNFTEYIPYIIPVIFLIISIIIWFIYGRDDPIVKTIEFYPPQGMNSLDLGYAYKGIAYNKDVTSLLIYLANKGYIKISETEKEVSFFRKTSIVKEFMITKVKDYDGNDENERLFLNGLFRTKITFEFSKDDYRKASEIYNQQVREDRKNGIDSDVDYIECLMMVNEDFRNECEREGTSVTKSDLDNRFYTTMGRIIRRTNKKKNKYKLFEKSSLNKAIYIKIMIAITFCLITVPPFFSGDYSTLFLILTFPVIFPAIGFTQMFYGIFYSDINPMTNTKMNSKLFGIIFGLIFSSVIFFPLVLPYLLNDSLYLIGYMVGLICVFGMVACISNLAKRTPYGRDMFGKICGFKKFLKTVEKEKLEAMVNENPAYFYDILPYTYVLGVSDKWIKNFETISLKAPDWYDSGSSTFDVVTFGSFVNETFTVANRVMSSNPNVDTGNDSSGSGSSGGGSSGGGSGGGGGGSW